MKKGLEKREGGEGDEMGKRDGSWKDGSWKDGSWKED